MVEIKLYRLGKGKEESYQKPFRQFAVSMVDIDFNRGIITIPTIGDKGNLQFYFVDFESKDFTYSFYGVDQKQNDVLRD